jgi:hypothetical protein
MKLTDKLVEKIGADKLLHFFVAAWVVSECKAFGIGVGCIAWIVVMMLAFVKEKWLDDFLDASDMLWSTLGGFASLILMVIKDIVV